MIIVFSAFLFSCSDTENIVEREEEFPQAKNYAKPLPLTHSEFLFQTKISELGNNTMDADFLNMSDLGIVQDGNPCGATVGLYYDIPLSNPNLVLLDGTTIWTSPWNSTSGCISQYLGYSNCLPIALDHNGQRVGYSNVLDMQGNPVAVNNTNLVA
ncbi:MAG TPA: hypothetical protein VKY44_01210 [Flavobacterium sp.]|nr:hypothetical protein [Flavobacterium sp.]